MRWSIDINVICAGSSSALRGCGVTRLCFSGRGCVVLFVLEKSMSSPKACLISLFEEAAIEHVQVNDKTQTIE